jgi:3-dehydroquinate dehydratase / shikimate dehydrogenase
MREPLVCLTAAARSLDDLRRQRDRAEGADLVELRLDYLDHPDAAAAIDGRRRPVIVTCRPVWEGGRFRGSEEERRRILTDALAAGAEFVDVEAQAGFLPDLMRCRRGRGIVLSAHFFGTIPDDLAVRMNRMRESGAEVIKIAIEAHGLTDTLRLFSLAEAMPHGEGPGHVLVAMGEPGVPSRVLAAQLRNRWTYAGDGVAPGQLSLTRLLGDCQFRRIRAGAAVYGVVGNPVSHSLSPRMHNAGFAARGLDAAYLPLHAQSAEDFARFGRALGLAGVSITAPFKVALMRYVDEIDSLAERVGAINTIVVEGGRWKGTNTDVHGFLAPLIGRMTLKGVRVSILGAGGAARGVAVALAEQGAVVSVCARRPDAAAVIAELVGGRVGTFPPKAGSWDVLVNAIPPSDPPVSPIAGAPLDGEIVFDLVYVPRETALLADARAAGCLTIGGIEMLVAQAERQFELWTGEAPPPGLFAAAAASAPPGGCTTRL